MGTNTIIGRKTFFIAPDPNLLPDTYLKNFMLRGYESYFIYEDDMCPLNVKVETLIKKYPGCLMFFCIDTPVTQVNWQTFLWDVRRRLSDEFFMFVLHTGRDTPEQVRSLESYYIKELGLEGRLVGLRRGDKGNFVHLDSILEANDARGRRKSVRAYCDPSSEVSFVRGFKTVTAKVLDVSVTHFSVEFGESENILPFYEKLPGVRLQINGLTVQADAVLILNRVREGISTGIFMFVKENGTPGMSDEVASTLGAKIYDMVSSETKIDMRKAFAEAQGK